MFIGHDTGDARMHRMPTRFTFSSLRLSYSRSLQASIIIINVFRGSQIASIRQGVLSSTYNYKQLLYWKITPVNTRHTTLAHHEEFFEY